MTKKKILYVATVDIHIKSFHLPYLKMMHDKGWEVHVATNGKEKFPYCDKKHTICMERSPFKPNNLKAIKQMKELLKKEHFDIIHCHTPMGSVVTRIAAKEARKNGTRVIYTAHGFHFYTGAPLINWLLFYPVEKYLVKYTDTLITINKEDYNRAKKKFSKRCHDIQYVPGVGIDPKKFDFKMTAKEKHDLRASLGLKDDDFVMIFPARLDKNKNQAFLIKCMPELIKENSNIHLLLVGPDELNGKYQTLVKKLNLSQNVHFLGKRDDVPQLLKISDIAISSSKREGLPVNILEALSSNIPVISTNCRGVNDLSDSINIIGGQEELKRAIKYEKIKKRKKIPERFQLQTILKRMEEIYIGTAYKTEKNNAVMLTIGIPVYNTANYVEELLRELSKINNKKIEIIVIDDGSTDDSFLVCKKYVSNMLKVIHQDNMGVSETRNEIIKKSRGEWITFIDSDDMVSADGYSNIIASLSLSEDWYINIPNNKLFRKISNDNNIERAKSLLIETEIINSPWNKFYKKEIVLKNHIKFDKHLTIGEDLLFNLKYSKYANNISYINIENLYKARLNENSITRSFNIKKYPMLIRANLRCNQIYESKRIKNALIYIKIKNCISCLRDYSNNDAIDKQLVSEVKDTRIDDRIVLNNLKTTLTYWSWKILPKRILVDMSKLHYRRTESKLLKNEEGVVE